MNMIDALRSARLDREKLLFRYTSALDRGDFEVIAQILSVAEADPELARMIAEMNDAADAHLQAEFVTAPFVGKPKSRRRFRVTGLAALISLVLVAGAMFLASLMLMPGLLPAGISEQQSAYYPTGASAATMMPLGTATPMAGMIDMTQIAGTPAPTQGLDQGSPVAPIEPMIIKNGDITMIVEDIGVAVDQVTLIASDGGGYVLSSQSWSADGRASAAMTIAVRADQFDTAMRRLRDIAMEVVQESASGQDVSSEYVDLQSRLRNLEATRDRIKSFLEQAATVDEALEINRQLAEIEAQIEQVKGRMTYLSGRAAFSTITVTMDEYEPITPTPTPTPTLTPTPTRTPSPWSLGPRIDRAVETQTSLARGLLELLVWLIIVPGPYLVGLGLIAMGVRWVITRNR